MAAGGASSIHQKAPKTHMTKIKHVAYICGLSNTLSSGFKGRPCAELACPCARTLIVKSGFRRGSCMELAPPLRVAYA